MLVWYFLYVQCFSSIWLVYVVWSVCFFFFKQKTAYEMRISDWSSDVCSSDLFLGRFAGAVGRGVQIKDQLFHLARHQRTVAIGKVGDAADHVGREAQDAFPRDGVGAMPRRPRVGMVGDEGQGLLVSELGQTGRGSRRERGWQ